MNSSSLDLLGYIYQNTKAGEETARRLADIAQDDAFRKHLYLQRQEYRNISKLATRILRENDYKETDLEPSGKVAADRNIGMTSMADRTPESLAEMLLQGSVAGMADAAGHLDTYADADREVLALARKLLRTEETNADNWKQYLS